MENQLKIKETDIIYLKNVNQELTTELEEMCQLCEKLSEEKSSVSNKENSSLINKLATAEESLRNRNLINKNAKIQLNEELNEELDNYHKKRKL